MLVNTYNQEGKKIGQTRLPKEIFGKESNPDLIHQVAVSMLANQRRPIAHTKDRSEKRGGGRKPWRQKGTGRARHGSIRSPIWRGGGVTFGPGKEKSYKKRIPRKMRKAALLSALSVKLQDKEVIVLDKLELKESKTKSMVGILKKLSENFDREGSVLLVLPAIDNNIRIATNNIPKVATIEARNLSVLDILSFKNLLLLKESLKVIEKTFGRNP